MAGGEAGGQGCAPLRPALATPEGEGLYCAPLRPARETTHPAPHPLHTGQETPEGQGLDCAPLHLEPDPVSAHHPLQGNQVTPRGQTLDCAPHPLQGHQETLRGQSLYCAPHPLHLETGAAKCTLGEPDPGSAHHPLQGNQETPRGQTLDCAPHPLQGHQETPRGQSLDCGPHPLQGHQESPRKQNLDCAPHPLLSGQEIPVEQTPDCAPHPLLSCQESPGKQVLGCAPLTLSGQEIPREQTLGCAPHNLLPLNNQDIPVGKDPNSAHHPLQDHLETLRGQGLDCAQLPEGLQTLQGHDTDCSPLPESLETLRGHDADYAPLPETVETLQGQGPDCASLSESLETLRGHGPDTAHHPLQLQVETAPGSTGTFYGTVVINNQRLTVRIENGLLTVDAREPSAIRPDLQSLMLKDGLDQLVLVSCESDPKSGHGLRGEPTSGDSQGHPSADSSLSPDSQRDSDTVYSIDETDIMHGQMANFFIDENGEVRVAGDLFGRKGLVLVYHCPQPDCRKTFDKKHKLKLHLLTQHTAQEQRPFRCSVEGCDWSFTTSYKLKRHLHSHGNLRPYTCPFDGCSKTFTTVYNLKAHGKTHDLGDTFRCGVCGEDFPSNGKLAGHRKIHFQPDRPYICEFPGCEKTFTTVSALFSHNRAHFREIEQFTCSFPGCNKQYDKACRLKIHLRSHTGERPFICDFDGCGWSFTSMSKLLRHNRKHADDRRFTCHIEGCGKSFTRAEHLKGHSIIHLGTKPFECPAEGCYAKFSARSSLYIHSKKHLQDVTTLKTRCPVSSCPRAFASKHSMKTHMVKQHHFSQDLLTQLEATHSLTPSSDLSSSGQNDFNNIDLSSLFSNTSSNSSGISSDMALVNSGILTIDVASVGSTLGGNLSVSNSSGQAVNPVVLVGNNEMPHNLENSLLLGSATSLLQQSTLNPDNVQTVNAEALGSMASMSLSSSNRDPHGLPIDATTLTPSSSLGGSSTVPEVLTIKAERNLLDGLDVVSQQEGNKVVTQFVFPNPTGGYSAQKEMDLSTVTGSSFLVCSNYGQFSPDD